MRFDDTALRAPVDEAAARAEGREIVRRDRGRGRWSAVHGLEAVKTAVVVVCVGVLASLLVVVVQYAFGAWSASASTFVIAGLMATPLAVARIRAIARGRGELERTWYRLSRFAAANGMSYAPVEAAPERPAALFGLGSARVARDVLRTASPRPIEAGNHSYDTWSARTRMPHSTAYVAFGVRAPLPRLTLAPAARGGEPPWPLAAGERGVAIADGFDDVFRAWCAPGDEDAVRRLLAPAVRDALVEVAGECGLEIVDGAVYVVAPRELPIADPAFWEWAEDLAGLVEEHLDPPPGAVGDAGAEDAGAEDAGDPARPTASAPGIAAAPASAASESGAALAADAGEGDRAAGPGRPRWALAAERRARRERLFAAPDARRSAAIGCLVPILFGVVAAALTARW